MIDKEAIKLLFTLASEKEKEISLYDLISRISKKCEEKNFEKFLKTIYYLSARNLVSLKTIDGEDGKEMSVKLTSFGENFIKAEKAVRRK